MRAGGPETGKANPSVSRNPEVQVGRDVTLPKDVRVGLATTSESPEGWGERSEGEKPRKASTIRRLRPVDDRTDSPREQGLEGDRVGCTSFGRGVHVATSGRQGLREEYPSCARGTPWRVKPRDAPALRRREDTRGIAAKGVNKPRTRLQMVAGTTITCKGPRGSGSVVGQESSREAVRATRAGRVSRPAGRRVRGRHVCVSEGARKGKEGQPSASAGGDLEG
jgi:hypothetical protein